VQLPYANDFAALIVVRIRAKTQQQDIVYSNAVILNHQLIYGPYELYADVPPDEAPEFKLLRERFIRQLPLPPVGQNYVWTNFSEGAMDYPGFFIAGAEPTLPIPGGGGIFSPLIFNDGRNVIYRIDQIFNHYDNCRFPFAEPGEYREFNIFWLKRRKLFEYSRGFPGPG
jgi:hypothetical protein